MFKRKVLVFSVVGVTAIAGMAVLAGAKGGVGGGGGGGGVAAVALKSKMTLVGGEDPTAPGVAATTAVATFDGKSRLRVHLPGMDPARFPAPSKRGTINPCTSTASIAGVSGPAPLLAGTDPTTGAAITTADLLATGTAKTGDSASIDVSCNIGGVVHETHWTGTLA